MNSKDIQKLLSSPPQSGEVILPAGEFEGPFYINKPCRVKGQGTTLWRGTGPVITIGSEGVSLENLRSEITNGNLPAEKSVSVFSKYDDTAFSGVEIIGKTKGLGDEDGPWGLPRVFTVGQFPADEECFYIAEIVVPTEAEIISCSNDIKVTPCKLSAGRNTITVAIAPVRSGSYLYGEIIVRSKLDRRIYISGSAEENASGFENGRVIFSADENALAEEEKALRDVTFEEEVIYPDMSSPLPDKNEMYKPEISGNDDGEEDKKSPYIITRGITVPIKCAGAEIELTYENKNFPMDVDAFAFMADKHGRVNRNDHFVFFGNDHSEFGEVKYLNAPDKKIMYINFNTIPLDVMQIDIAYSIYENPAGLNFSNLKNPAIKIRLSDKTELIYRLEPPLDKNTLVGVGLMFRQQRWELSPLGMIYPRGLADLCSNYGLKIM